jgi:hypothetical protein
MGGLARSSFTGLIIGYGDCSLKERAYPLLTAGNCRFCGPDVPGQPPLPRSRHPLPDDPETALGRWQGRISSNPRPLQRCTNPPGIAHPLHVIRTLTPPSWRIYGASVSVRGRSSSFVVSLTCRSRSPTFAESGWTIFPSWGRHLAPRDRRERPPSDSPYL